MAIETVILADGSFPEHDLPLEILRNAVRIVCCDGAAVSLVKAGMEPFAIVGDCDSLTEEIAAKYRDRIFPSEEQETNDLTKAVKWCAERGYNDLVILGATGKREDHTIGNISLLIDYSSIARVRMVTDNGILIPVTESGLFDTEPGQQVSVFSIDPGTEITSSGLKYPLTGKKLRNWWEATLNEATGNQFSLQFSKGALILFLKYPSA